MSPKVIDLSMPCSNSTPGVNIELQNDLPVYMGHECYAYDLKIRSHTGTYFETAAHLFRDAANTDGWPLEKLILPGIYSRITTPQRCITAEMLAQNIAAMPANHALLVDVGTNDSSYFSRDAAEWMVDNQVALMGSNTLRYDSGFENPTGFFDVLFRGDIPIIANITNLDLLSDSGFTVIALPLHVEGVCTVPCRVIAVIEPPGTNHTPSK